MAVHGEVAGGCNALSSPLSPSSAAALLARESGENFPVALRVLPRRHREALHAVYAFARTVDEVGDSADPPEAGDSGRRGRLSRLADLDAAVSRTWAGRPFPATGSTGPAGSEAVFRWLADAGVPARVPERWFHDLVEANVRDQRVTRYSTFEDLRGYCRLSADPVGRIVLHLFGEHTGPNPELSDQVCTALQLLEHWQDVAEDWRLGRVYLPQEDLTRYGLSEAALVADLAAGHAGPAVAGLMRFETERATRLLAEGAPLVGRLRGWARLSVGGFVAGGEATAAALRRSAGDVIGRRTAPTGRGTAAALLRLVVTGHGRRTDRR
jgi:squalene synthase HpnC